VLLVWAPLTSLSLVGQEHGRTIPLADIVQRPIFWVMISTRRIFMGLRPAISSSAIGWCRGASDRNSISRTPRRSSSNAAIPQLTNARP